jgi:hypothetical protein
VVDFFCPLIDPVIPLFLCRCRQACPFSLAD